MLSYFSDTAVVQGNFRNHHAGYHSIADMAYVVGGALLRELTGALFITAYEQPAQHVIWQAFADPLSRSYVLCTGSGILGVSIGFNTLSTHAACTVWWSFLATIAVTAAASVRKFQKVAWLTWAGFVSIFIAVFIVAYAFPILPFGPS